MSHCCDHSCCTSSSPSVRQTLDELDFERGIWFAAQHNDIERVEKLLKQGTCVNKEDAAGYCALHYAARSGHLEMCQLLLQAGANPNALTRAGQASPLHRSATIGHADIVRLLLQSGARPELQDADGKTALHRAVEAGHSEIVKSLLNASPENINMKDIVDLKGKHPVDYAKENSELLAILK